MTAEVAYGLKKYFSVFFPAKGGAGAAFLYDFVATLFCRPLRSGAGEQAKKSHPYRMAFLYQKPLVGISSFISRLSISFRLAISQAVWKTSLALLAKSSYWILSGVSVGR